MTQLTLENIRKSYDAVEVLKGVSHQIDDGCFFTLLGPSGCGKTTLLRVVAGFVRPTGGSVSFGEQDVTNLPPHRREVGMVFQDYALFPDKSVFDNVAYGLRARGHPRSDIQRDVGVALEKVGLTGFDGRSPNELSGGQQQRVALARALVIKPRVLLMDEPLSNLDASLRVQMRDVIRLLQIETKTTTIFVTHDQEEALAMSDQIAVIKDGKIDQCGAPEVIYRNPATAYVADFVGAANVLPAKPKGEIRDGRCGFDVLGITLTGRVTGNDPNGQYLLVARPEDITIQKNSGKGANDQFVGSVVSSQFQGYRTSSTIALQDGLEVKVDTLGHNNTTSFARGDEVTLSFGDDLLFVPEVSR